MGIDFLILQKWQDTEYLGVPETSASVERVFMQWRWTDIC